MSRLQSVWRVALAIVGALALAAVLLLWPTIATEQRRAGDAARGMAVAMVPTAAVDAARMETRPTAYGWRVVFRDVGVPCAETGFRCAPSAGASSGASPAGASPAGTSAVGVIRDVLVCVEYGSARGYFIAGMVHPVAWSSWRDAAGGGCVRSQLPPASSPPLAAESAPSSAPSAAPPSAPVSTR